MSLISVVLAWLQTLGLGLDVFFDRLVVIEEWFYYASWWAWGIALCIIIGIAISWLIAWATGKIEHGTFFGFGGFFGCIALFCLVGLILLPLTSWVTLQLATGMAEAYGPAGVTSDSFWLSFVLFILFTFSGG